MRFHTASGQKSVVSLLVVLVTLLLSTFMPASAATGVSGTIAYVSGTTEIHLIQPDGTQDHRIWMEPATGVANYNYDVSSLAWRPDGRELAFASDHEESASIYNRDIYAIQPDGSGLRRLTNPPDVAALPSLAKGTVTVDVTNQVTDLSVFFVYIA